MERQNECIVEALLFAAGEPVSAEHIAKVLEVETQEAVETVEHLKEVYDREHRGMQILRLETVAVIGQDLIAQQAQFLL